MIYVHVAVVRNIKTATADKKGQVNMKKILILFIIMFAALSSAYAENDNKSKGSLLDNFAEIKTFTADFTQINYLTEFGESTYSGKVFIKMKDKALWDYTEPYKIWYLITDNRIEFYDELANQLMKISTKDIKEQIVLQILTDIKSVSKSFKITEDKNTLKLIPVKDFGLKSIEITFKDNMISEMKSVDNTNNVSKISFTNIKVNEKISNNVFKKKVPKDAEIFEEK